MDKFIGIGVMTGSSLDGIDIICAEYTCEAQKYKYSILASECIDLPPVWQARLEHLPKESALNFCKTNSYFGHYLGKEIKTFIQKHALKVDFAATHGQTIFHQPKERMTVQIGDGAAIAATCGIPVITEFRRSDMAYGGQGTPIVPICDQLLFPSYNYCLNLGGFSNISFKTEQSIIGFDTGACNLVLNRLAQQLGFQYDNEGNIARNGSIDEHLLKSLNCLPFIQANYPKSLGTDWVWQEMWPIIENNKSSVQDKIATVVAHIAYHICSSIKQTQRSTDSSAKLLVTGGGAHNTFLLESISKQTDVNVIKPSDDIINFKEALLMGLMGVLRLQEKPNCLASVTGASRNSVSGAIYLP